MNPEEICHMTDGQSPVITTAIHAGHVLRPYLEAHSRLTDAQRRQEEDPYTDIFARASDRSIVVATSRFEVDLNRPRSRAVYLKPEDAWGLQMWREKIPAAEQAVSLAKYDRFYVRLREMLDASLRMHGRVIVLDIHSYNHRRRGEKAPFDDPEANPEINVGTGTLKNRARWQKEISACMDTLSGSYVMGRYLDVRENVKFKGGHMAWWIHENYENVCCLSIEFKKIFMNEWSGEENPSAVQEIENLLRNTVSALQPLISAQ